MTTFVMSILIGLSVFLTKILSFIPMAVLYGVFMFMGVSALRGMQVKYKFEKLISVLSQPDTQKSISRIEINFFF